MFEVVFSTIVTSPCDTFPQKKNTLAPRCRHEVQSLDMSSYYKEKKRTPTLDARNAKKIVASACSLSQMLYFPSYFVIFSISIHKKTSAKD